MSETKDPVTVVTLLDGRDIIGTLVGDPANGAYLHVVRPMMVAITEDRKIAYLPLAIHADPSYDAPLPIARSHVLTHYPARKEMVEQYTRRVSEMSLRGRGIVVPGSGILVPEASK